MMLAHIAGMPVEELLAPLASAVAPATAFGVAFAMLRLRRRSR